MTRHSTLRSLKAALAVSAFLFLTTAVKAQQVVNLTFYIYSAASLPSNIPPVSVTSTGSCTQVAPPYAYPGASEFSVNLNGPIATDSSGNFKIDCGFKATSGQNSFSMTNLYVNPKTSKLYGDLTVNGGPTSSKVEIMDGYTGAYPYNGVLIPYAFFYLAPNLVSQIKTDFGIDAMYTYASVISLQ